MSERKRMAAMEAALGDLLDAHTVIDESICAVKEVVIRPAAGGEGEWVVSARVVMRGRHGTVITNLTTHCWIKP